MLEFFLDLIFPQACVTCGAIGAYVCPNCYRQMSFYDVPLSIDLPKLSLEALYACSLYSHTAKDLIRTYKYQEAYALSQTIAQLMYWHMPKPIQTDFLVPVPLHKSRQRSRGFNQAELLAQKLSKYWNIPMLKALTRIKATSPQAELGREERLDHLKDAFSLSPKIDVTSLKNKSFALIDDVATTGTTLNECAKTLKLAEVAQVRGIVFAHGN